MTYGALGYDGNELMAFISGYDLEIKFNLRIINSLGGCRGMCRRAGTSVL